MSHVLNFIIAVVIWLIAVTFVLFVSSLIFWGIGNIIITIFQINYDWTMWHGFASSLIFAILSSVFSSNK